jgi:hypothetical protein
MGFQGFGQTFQNALLPELSACRHLGLRGGVYQQKSLFAEDMLTWALSVMSSAILLPELSKAV